MVKRAFPFFLLTIFLALFLLGCSPTFCSTPYILSDNGCCLDKNKDNLCDAQQDLSDADKKPSAQPLALVDTPQASPDPSEQDFLLTNEGILLTVHPDDDPSQGNTASDALFIVF